jgi:hypothetical protein
MTLRARGRWWVRDRSRLRRIAPVVAALAISIAAFCALPALRGYEALLMLTDLLGRPAPRWLDFRPPATRRAVGYEHDTRRFGADLYRPEGEVRAGVVFVPGAVELGKDDPRAVGFATMLARSRFAVLVPDIVAMRELRLLPDGAVDVAAALDWLQVQPELVPDGRLGVVTTSVAIGPSLIALLESPRAADVRFFVSIGGYHDLPRLLAYWTTGSYDAHGVSRDDAPNDYGRWIAALSNAVHLPDRQERAAFEALVRRKLVDPAADISDDVARLGFAGKQLYAFIANTDPARSSALFADLPDALRADVERLDLAARNLATVQARFILVHGADDGMIPYGESLGLARALPEGRARLFVISGFRHVETAPLLVGGFELWRALRALLAEATR